jgi:hypothetical protein
MAQGQSLGHGLLGQTVVAEPRTKPPRDSVMPNISGDGPSLGQSALHRPESLRIVGPT